MDQDVVSMSFISALNGMPRNNNIPLCKWALGSENPSYYGLKKQGRVTYFRLV